jgi:predicted nuclease with TOPRIM domain
MVKHEWGGGEQMPDMARMQQKVEALEEKVNELKSMLSEASRTSHDDDLRLHERIDEVEGRVRVVEQEVREVVLKIPSSMKDLERNILKKMDSDQVDQLKGVLKSYRSIVAKLGWAIIGIISSVITALILSYLSLK